MASNILSSSSSLAKQAKQSDPVLVNVAKVGLIRTRIRLLKLLFGDQSLCLIFFKWMKVQIGKMHHTYAVAWVFNFLKKIVFNSIKSILGHSLHFMKVSFPEKIANSGRGFQKLHIAHPSPIY